VAILRRRRNRGVRSPHQRGSNQDVAETINPIRFGHEVLPSTGRRMAVSEVRADFKAKATRNQEVDQ
jgi:hypothetical protein